MNFTSNYSSSYRKFMHPDPDPSGSRLGSGYTRGTLAASLPDQAGDFPNQNWKSLYLSAKISNSFCQNFQRLIGNSGRNRIFQTFSPFLYQKIECKYFLPTKSRRKLVNLAFFAQILSKESCRTLSAEFPSPPSSQNNRKP